MFALFPLFLLLPPAAALAAIALLKPSMKFGYVAAAASAASMALLYFVQQGSATVNWFSIGATSIPITTSIAPLNLILLAIIFAVGALIYVYSAGYMNALSEQKRFYAEMLAFQISMAAFAMSGNFILLLIAWEFLSLFSYLLIGFWHTRERASRAARLAITTVLIGDIALLASIVIFWNLFGTFNFAAIIAAMPSAAPVDLYAAAFLLMIAIFTKSAQFPFQEWLPEAMEGPTPVSAFLHSTTMVKAGVFTAIILFPIFSAAKLLPVIVIFGIVTALLSTLDAMREKQIKKVIAYSTVQELSLMLVAIGSGAIIAAIYFFIVQSFYKALLFFSAGGIMKATKEESLDSIRGLKSNTLLYVSTLFGVLSIAGLIPFSGFFAAAGVDASLVGTIWIYSLISIIGLGTSFFIFRWFFLVSREDRSSLLRYNAIPKTMVYPAVILAILALAGSAIFFYISGFVSGAGAMPYIEPSSPLSLQAADAAVVTALFAIGATIGYYVYGRAPKASQRKKSGSMLGTMAYTHRLFIFLYGACAKFVYEISEGVGAFDGYLNAAFDFMGHLVVLASRGIRRISVGGINPYALIFASGIVAMLAYVYIVIR